MKTMKIILFLLVVFTASMLLFSFGSHRREKANLELEAAMNQMRKADFDCGVQAAIAINVREINKKILAGDSCPYVDVMTISKNARPEWIKQFPETAEYLK